MFQTSYKRIGIALAGMLMSLSSLFGALPAGYTQLAFLESSGTQYIDTGVVFGKTNGFSVTSQSVAPISNQIVCGSRVDGGDTRCMVGVNYLNNKNFAYVGWNEVKTSGWVDDYDMGTTVVNFLNSGTYDCRRRLSGSLGALASQTSPFYLFGAKTTSSDSIIYGKCRIREVQISAGTNVIRHFIPARRDSDSELGMYDLVNDVFYVNQGTGTFIGGDPVTQSGPDAYVRLAWLESWGGQYIDTGVIFTDSHGFSVTYQATGNGVGNNMIICGSRASSGHTRCMAGSNNNSKSETFSYVGWNTLCTSYSIRDESEGTVKVNYLNSRTWDCRGQTNGVLDTTLTAQPGTFYLFAGNMAYSGGSTIYSKCRIMSFVMTHGNEVVMDMVPVRRKVDGKPGMYDTLHDTFYVNQGVGEFVAGEPLFPDGYVGLDFIESTGTQYINTGVKCASNVVIRATVYNAHPASKHFIGAREAYQVNAIGLSFQTETGAEGYCASWGTTRRVGIMGNNLTNGVGDAFHEFEFGGPYARADGVYPTSAGMASSSFATDLDIYAFAVNNNGTPHNQTPSIRISSLKMYKNGSLVRDFIPVMPTNSLAPGLYDVQNDVFYGNVGTGQFLAGEIVRGIDAPDAFGGEGIPESEIVGAAQATKSFAVQKNGFYRLWFQYKGGATGGTGHSLAASMDGTALGTVSTTTTNGWTSANFDVKLNAGSHVLTLQGSGTNKSTVIDSATLRCLYQLPSGMIVIFK